MGLVAREIKQEYRFSLKIGNGGLIHLQWPLNPSVRSMNEASLSIQRTGLGEFPVGKHLETWGNGELRQSMGAPCPFSEPYRMHLFFFPGCF